MTTPNPQYELEKEAQKLIAWNKLIELEQGDILFFAEAYASHKVAEERESMRQAQQKTFHLNNGHQLTVLEYLNPLK